MTDAELDEIKALQDELICKGGRTKGQPKKAADPVKLERLKALLDAQRAETANATEKPEEPKNDASPKPEPTPEAPKTEAPKMATADLVMAERELRRYVRRDGGFRLGLKEAGIKEAERLMAILGRKEPRWDLKIAVPGFKI